MIGGRAAAAGGMAKPKVEINREPILTVNLSMELVEILPGGVNVLGRLGGAGGIRAEGGTFSGFTSIAGVGRFQQAFKVVQIDASGIVADVTISDASGATVLSQRLALKNYQEALVELAASAGSGKRLAIRILPTLATIPAIQDYPALVQTLAVNGILILNRKDVIARDGGVAASVDLNGTKQQFVTISGPSGLLVLSYRPFQGATLAGYFEDKKLLFEWNGDMYEWLSLDKPFLPEGKWSAYVWQADNIAGATGGVGVFSADPNDVQNAVSRMLERRRKAALEK